MSSIRIHSTHITNTVNNSRFEIEFERSIDLTKKHISLTSASLYFSWRNITNFDNKFSYMWIEDIEYYVIPPVVFLMK